MTIIAPMDRQGPYIPFEKPIPVPVSLADEEPLSHICFSSEWLPFVIGALKVLARPETWEGTDLEINAVSRSAHDLLAAFYDGCPETVPVCNWHLGVVMSHGFYDANAWNSPKFGVGYDDVPWIQYDLICWSNDPIPPSLEVRGLSNDTLAHVGGQFEHCQISSSSDPAGQSYVATITDCLGSVVVHSDFTPRNYFGQFQTVNFVAGNNVVYWLKIEISGNWLCGGA